MQSKIKMENTTRIKESRLGIITVGALAIVILGAVGYAGYQTAKNRKAEGLDDLERTYPSKTYLLNIIPKNR
jgi:hypothetical protein